MRALFAAFLCALPFALTSCGPDPAAPASVEDMAPEDIPDDLHYEKEQADDRAPYRAVYPFIESGAEGLAKAKAEGRPAMLYCATFW